MMDKMGLGEGEVIQHSMISKSIERAQRKVEENNFGIRKNLLEYDDVMNSQREVVYKRRRHALYGERLQVDVVNMIYDTCANLVSENKESENYNNFEFELIRFSSTSSPFNEEEFKSKTQEELTDELYQVVYQHYKEKIERNAIAAYPVIKDVYEKQGSQYERIVVPFTDGVKTIQVVTNLKDAYESKGKVLVTDFEKNVTLAIIDDTWKDHLRQMDDLKQSVRNAQYEQKDPLLIYKFESFELFNTMLNKVNKEVLSFLFKGELPTKGADQVSQEREPKRDKVQLTKEEYQSQSTSTNQTQDRQPVETFVRTERKIGRNDRVTIKNVMSGENKAVKYKQAIPLIEKGEWVLTEE
jgi:preprotein translocase subunit SecA